jgi:O-antigen ligase
MDARNPPAAPLVAAKAAVAPPSKRLWGIDLVGAVCGIAALIATFLFFVGPPTEQDFAFIAAPLCAFLCCGIFFRMNGARKILLILLGLALGVYGFVLLYYLGALTGAVEAPANEDATFGLVDVLAQIGVALAVFIYLRRSTVKQSFQRIGTS